MAQLTRRIAAIAAVGAFSLPAAAGQEEQFTPEFSAVRSTFHFTIPIKAQVTSTV